ncbi:MAG: hypothetical protein M0T72_02635 [Candidatus Dormibacteraeota bacterium]|nr:hypothetical protein [Candidatus Dormibacteraeota bacterium]
MELGRIDPDSGPIGAGHLTGGSSPHILGLLILELRRRVLGLGAAACCPGLAHIPAMLAEGA